MRCSDTRMVMWVWGSFLFRLRICRWRRRRWPQMPGGAHDDNEDAPDEEGSAGGVMRRGRLVGRQVVVQREEMT